METTTWLLADEAAEYMRMDRDSVYEYLQRRVARGEGWPEVACAPGVVRRLFDGGVSMSWLINLFRRRRKPRTVTFTMTWR